ncbi:histidine phosphatase family protein [Siccirubricoccus sp. KC 17139]|uniref:Histidine phosphatase family protein n=1 Tax=Siccirubricoccus soli TaxID=2899147 RepID=A0ABT1DC26_9PROT|nr:histidine phosphatase family protein [Siccirubricoccus soli]MCO6419493.1 histidine phosphatase family protein [Siccirubricoccus soli]MCP2685628.1 histidine phosphatase family protein [Siccirubricoccus soli]
MAQQWPDRLWLVRHGESSGNVARDAAHAAGLTHIETGGRDVDVPLSPLGERQSRALGSWFAAMPAEQRPNVVLTSPYRRARQTAALIHACGGVVAEPPDFILDERLREKEFGILDRLTRHGIERLHPDQAEFRRILGKFYHRPPGGESWCDVILRLRSALDSVSLHHGGARVLVVAHQVVVLCARYLIERMTEEQILAIDAEGDVANCSVTEYLFDPDYGRSGGLVLKAYNQVAPLQQQGAPVTAEADAPAGAR